MIIIFIFLQVTDANCPPTFNSQQLEECDAMPMETTLLVRLEAKSHEVSHRVCIKNYQFNDKKYIISQNISNKFTVFYD